MARGPFILFLAAALLRLAHLYLTRNNPYFNIRVQDEYFYHRWASDIAGGAFGPDRAYFTSPLYAYALAILYRVFGTDISTVRLLNAVLGIGGLGFAFLAAKRLLGDRLAAFALAGLTFSFAPIFYESFAEKTTFVFFLTALAILLVSRALEPHEPSQAPSRWLLAGAACGMAALAHPTQLLLAGATAIAIAVKRRKEALVGLLELAPFAVGAILAVAPATIHNWRASKDLVLISYGAGANFYLGNHKSNPDGAYWSPSFQSSSDSVSEEADFVKEAERQLGRKAKPSEVSRYFFHRGLSEMREVPRLALARIWNRFRWVFGAEELMDTHCVAFYRGLSPVLSLPILLSFSAVSFWGIMGLLFTWRETRFLFLNLFVVLLSVCSSLFVVHGRYRLPLLLPLAILGCTFLGRLKEFFQVWPPWKKSSALILAAATLWFLCSDQAPAYMRTPALDYYNMSVHYLSVENDREKAIAELEKAMAVSPNFIPAAEQLSKLYFSSGRFAAAIPLFDRVLLRANPTSETWNNYGVALALSKERQKASQAFATALKLNPNSSEARDNLDRIAGHHP